MRGMLLVKLLETDGGAAILAGLLTLFVVGLVIVWARKPPTSGWMYFVDVGGEVALLRVGTPEEFQLLVKKGLRPATDEEIAHHRREIAEAKRAMAEAAARCARHHDGK